MKKKILLFLSLCCCAALWSAEKDILNESKWRLYTGGGADVKVEKSADGTVKLTRANENGVGWFYNPGSEYPVIPGNVYRIGVVYDGNADGSLMVQVIGAKRTPYPSAAGKNGVAQLAFVARAGENKARIHFGIKKPGTVTVKRIYIDESAGKDNLLLNPEISWKTVHLNGAKGTLKKNPDGTFLMNRDNNSGAQFFYNAGSEYPVKPGKIYRIGVEYAGNVDGSVMLQILGPKRNPYYSARGKNGIAEYSFAAGKDASRVRIHFSIPNAGKVLIKRIFLEESDPSDNLLLNSAIQWRNANIGGAESSMTKAAGKRIVRKSNTAGFTAVVPVADLPIVPGKNYCVSVVAKRKDNKVSYSLMFQMPGSKRTPFPTVASAGLTGEPETMEYIFTARSDEKLLRPHVMVRGQGEVEISKISIREISDQELKKLKDAKKIKAGFFNGDALKKSWQKIGVIRQGDPSRPFVEFASAPGGGIGCSDIEWKASEIKALEVDFKVADEGGYLSCEFTTGEGDKKYKSELGFSVLPDGKWHRIMFPVSEDPAWRGIVTGVKFLWRGQSAPVGFKSVNAAKQINRIYDLRPRGEYTLSRLDGSNTKAELHFLDRYYRNIGKSVLPAGEKSVKFTVPELCMTVRRVPESISLLAELDKLPKLDRPPAYWRGQWIWCWNGFGPDSENVWFRREFDLDAVPDEGELVIAGDDMFYAYVNGVQVGRGADWTTPGKFDIAKYLKPGKNSLVIQVYNVQAWGGLLCELYARVNGRPEYIVSDKNWRCHVGGKTVPAVFERDAMELGIPPVAPWNTRVGYQYVGPKGKIRVLKAGVNSFIAEVLQDTPVDSDKLTLTAKDVNGKSKSVSAVISPATGKWKKGEKITVKLAIPKQFSAASLFNNSDFLVVEDQAKLCDVKVDTLMVPPVSTARVVGAGERPYFEINGRRYSPIYFLLSGGFAKQPESRYWMIRNARAIGCEVMRHSASFQTFWKAENSFDFSALDRRLETVANLAPGTKIIINVNTGMPRWWLAKNPGDQTAYFGGKKPHREKDLQALASKNWLKDARIGLAALIKHLQQSPYADMIIGIGLSEGWNSEWFWSYVDDSQRYGMAGYSPADHATFRSYLRERYHTDEALQKAWKISGVTIDNAPMPTDKQWRKGSTGVFLDPQKDMQLIDWFRFRNRCIGEAITTLARYVKEASGGKWMAGAYYGYLVAFSNIYDRLQTVGHLDIERVARSPYVDFLTAPSYYTWRHAGQGDAIMQAAESFTAHGKLIIVEQDLRTYGETSNYEIKNGMLSTPEQSVGALDRAIALTMTRGVGTHWLEMYENWFREPLLIKVMNEGKKAYEALGEVKGTTPVEVALISDPESAMFVKANFGDGLHVASIGEMQRRFQEVAVPFRHVLLKDMLESDVVPAHKFYIVNNLVMLDRGERKALMERFAREKATVLWLYAAGVSTPEKGPSAELMSDFLGIRFRMDNGISRPELRLNNGSFIKKIRNFNVTSPWFYPVSGFQEVIGKTLNGTPGLVKWQKDGVTHYFSTLMNLPPVLIRDLAKKSGVHIYANSGDPVLVGNDVVALHAKESGKKRIFLPSGMKMNAVLGPLKGEFESGENFDAVSGQTYIFHVVKK